MKPEDAPYTLNSPDERARRAAMSNQPHIAPLANYLAGIKAAHSDKEVPGFDPCDGGIGAKALFLLEAPGPKAVGSAFISRNNPDPTARNLCELLLGAGIARRHANLEYRAVVCRRRHSYSRGQRRRYR